ncbi:MAG TPA: hypothetical protein VK678_22615, partial [Bradyrhizobium sp.]|nr:hypothetical protein [Bradyrhizobium sp.]
MNIAERPRALARLAKADGLILLTLEQVDPLHRSISARLSSTSSGLIQKTVMLPAGGKELPMAAKLAADALQHSAERLGTAGNTPKHIVSLLGIRAAVNSAPSIALETTLNAAVTHHLGRIPGLAVVERWKLDDVAFERSLSEKDMPPLATGTTLVNGSFELKAGVVVVKVRLRNSEKDAGKTLVVEGPSEDAFALAEAIASKVAAECGSHTTPAAWDARAEAAAYAKLGEWLLGLRMGIAAAQAYESAVALGDKSAETLTGRIEAYVRVSSPALGLLFDVSTYHSDDRRLAEGKKHFQVDLVGATRAAAYCGEFAGRFPDMDSHSKKGVDLVGETVRKACDVLIAAHRLRVHMEQPGEVATLRQQTESLVKVIKHREERFSRFKLDGYAGYWAATPEDAVERWRELLKPEVPPGYLCWHRRMTLQGQRIGMKWGQPFIPDWTTPDDSLGSAAWQRLIAELSASKSLISQADAIALSAYSAATQAEVDKLQTQYIEFMERNRAALAHPEGHALFYVYDPLQNFPVMAEKCERYASLLTSAFTDSANIEMHALDGIRHAILHFKTSELDFNQKRKVSKEAGAKLLKAITDFSTRARTAGLPTSYRGHGYSGPDELAQLLAGIFRDLTDAPSTERPASGVPVRYLNLQLPGDRSDSSAWVNCYRMGQIEDRLIVQRLSEDGFVSVRGDLSMELIPPLPGGDFQRPQLFPAKDGFLFLSRENGLWRYGYQEKKWSEVPGIPHQKEQIVGMVGDAFYIAGGGTIGRVKAGRYELIASSR